MPRKPYTAPARPPEHKLFLTSAEIAQVLGMTPVTVCRLISSGQLLGAKVGRQYLVPRHHLDCYIEAKINDRIKIVA